MSPSGSPPSSQVESLQHQYQWHRSWLNPLQAESLQH